MPYRVNNLLYLARVWRANARAAITREMEFRINFLSGLLRQLMWLAAFLLMIHAIFRATSSLAGWNQAQVIVVLALSRLIEGLSDTFFIRNISEFPSTVQSGSFDFYLTKPVPSQFHTAFHRFKFLDLGNALIGLFLLAYAVTLDPSLLSTSHLILFIFLALLGMTIYYSIMMTIASLAFFLERFEAFAAIDNLVTEPLTVPFDIFPSGVRLALTYLLPLAFIVFVPAQALTGRLQFWQLPLALIVTVLFLLLTNLVWHAGLKHYSSASS